MVGTDRSYMVVAFSPQPSLAFFLKGVLDCAGLTAIACSSSIEEITTIAERMHPDAIVYDVSYPFAENWQQLQQLRNHPLLRTIPFVITTSEAGELFRTVGYSGAIELVARPSDLSAFQTAVRSLIETTVPGRAA